MAASAGTLTATASAFLHCLRALLSQAVLFGHVLALNGMLNQDSIWADLPSFAVLCFFVLSGFVISWSTFRKGRDYGLTNYLIDRFTRLWTVVVPTLFITLAIGLIAWLLSGSPPFEMHPWHFLSVLTMQQENPLLLELKYHLPDIWWFDIVDFFGDNLPLWSLSLEWWYYVFFGFWYYTKGKKSGANHLVLLLLSLPFVIGYAILPGRAWYGLTFIWFAGVALSAAYTFLISKKKHQHIWGITAVLLLLLTAWVFAHWRMPAIVPFAAFLGCALIHFSQERKGWQRAFNMLRIPADYSFSLYCVHYPVLLFILHFTEPSFEVAAAGFIISNGIAYAMYLLFESKYKRIAASLKQRLKKQTV
jgi:peptidoglycan/LPS O-acetylase OafA/YrhL